MKILYLHQHFSTPKGAGGIRSYRMARRLIERGHQVTMVTGRHGSCDTGLTGPYRRGLRRGTVDGIDVIEVDLPYSNDQNLARRSFIFFRFVMRTIGIVLRERYDLIFATTTPLTVGVAGIAGRWLHRKPFVFEVRDLWPELPKAMGVIRNPFVLTLLSLLEWASYRSADRLIGLSPGIVEGIIRRGIPPRGVTMISNGCDTDIFAIGAPAWRPEGVKPEDLLAIYTGTHGVANGLDALCEAAAELQRRGRPDIKILLVGEGRLKPALQARAAREDLANLLFHDPVPKHRLAGLMEAADIGLQILANVPAFYYGTSPNKFFDYLAAGLPVLSNYPGWVCDLVAEHRCGFAVPPNDPVAFADALERAADDRIGLRDMGTRARMLAEQEFERTMLADRWVDWVTGMSAPGANPLESPTSRARLA